MTTFDINDLPKIGDIIVSDGQEFVVDQAGMEVKRYSGLTASALRLSGLMSLEIRGSADRKPTPGEITYESHIMPCTDEIDVLVEAATA